MQPIEEYQVSFTIRLRRDPIMRIMFPREMRENIKYWLESEFKDYFELFHIKNLTCKRIKNKANGK